MTVAILILLLVLWSLLIVRILLKYQKGLYWYLAIFPLFSVIYGLFVIWTCDIFDSVGYYAEADQALAFGIIYFYFVTLPVVFISSMITAVSLTRRMYKHLK